MMITRSLVLAAVVLMAASGSVGTSAADEARTTVQVTVQYAGGGVVDSQHRIWIWLFDTPDFGSGAAMPLAERALSANGTTASFSGVSASQVWVAVAYDEAGGFAGSAPPPSGSPLGVYMENGAPSPVAPGDSASVRVEFDDSVRMP